MTEDELFEDVRFWKERANAAEQQLWDAERIIEDLLGLKLGSSEMALLFLNRVSGSPVASEEHS